MGSRERRQREKEQRKNQILDAARTVLIKKGIAGTSMNQIARAAELSVGTLYLYFKNREELFAALQEEGLDLLHEMIRKAEDENREPREKLQGMAWAYLEFSEKHSRYYDIMNYFLTSPETAFPSHLKSNIDEHGDRILSLVEKALLECGVDNLKAKRCALVFWSSLQGMLQLRKLQHTILSNENYRDVYLFGVECVIKSFVDSY